MNLVNQLIGVASIAIMAVFFIAGEVFGRLVVVPLVWILPRHREAIPKIALPARELSPQAGRCKET